MRNVLKIVGVACFNASIGWIFVFFYRTDLLFSMVVPQIWTLAYGISLFKGRKEK